MTISLATFEAVDGALQAYLRQPELPPVDQGRAASRAWFRTRWTLQDTCIVAGMPLDHVEPAEWASEFITFALASGSFVETDGEDTRRRIFKGDLQERRPFAHCCAEGGGRVEGCSCVNPVHGSAWHSIGETPGGAA